MTKKRIQFDISENSYERLLALKEATGASSIAEVTNKSLRLYEYLSQHLAGGSTLFLRDQSEREVQIVLVCEGK